MLLELFCRNYIQKHPTPTIFTQITYFVYKKKITDNNILDLLQLFVRYGLQDLYSTHH